MTIPVEEHERICDIINDAIWWDLEGIGGWEGLLKTLQDDKQLTCEEVRWAKENVTVRAEVCQ